MNASAPRGLRRLATTFRRRPARAAADPFRTLWDTAFEPLVAHVDGRIVDTNPAFQRTFGYTSDEALHLTGAFHLAGYQHVVGTLWPVDDEAATRVATGFYADLTREGTAPPDTADSARALHRTIRALRSERPGTPAWWAAHTHTGI